MSSTVKRFRAVVIALAVTFVTNYAISQAAKGGPALPEPPRPVAIDRGGPALPEPPRPESVDRGGPALPEPPRP